MWAARLAICFRAAAETQAKKRISLHFQNDFTELGPRLEVGVRLRTSRQGEDTIDHRLEAARGGKLHDLVQLGLGAHVGAQYRKLTAEEEPKIDFGVVSGGGSASHETAPGGQAGEAFLPRGRSHVFEDHVNAGFAGDAANLLANSLRSVVDDVVGAKLFGFLQFFLAPGRGDDPCAKKFRDLNRSAANAASATEDQRGISGRQVGASSQHMPRGLNHQGYRGRFLEGKMLWIGQAIDFGSANEFGATSIDQVA